MLSLPSGATPCTFAYGAEAEPGWPGKHMLDAWHIVVPGPQPTSILIASWDLDGTSKHHDQQEALLNSIRLGVR